MKHIPAPLSQILHVAIPSNGSADGKSPFSKSLASDVSSQDAPLKALTTAPNPRSQTPALHLLILVPLLTSKPKSVARNPPVPTPASCPFLAPSSASTSLPTPTLTHFSTPLSSFSTQVPLRPLAQPQTPLLNKSAVSQKTSKIVTDKILALEAQVGLLEDKLKNIQGSLVNMMKVSRSQPRRVKNLQGYWTSLENSRRGPRLKENCYIQLSASSRR